MTTDETTTAEVAPLFLNSHHLLLAVVATIAAEHGIEATRELVDGLADDDAIWQDLGQKLGLSAVEENAIDTEPPPPPDETAAEPLPAEPLSATDYESAGPDATGPTVIETLHASGDSSILPPPLENGEANGRKPSAHA
jgi:hypothetical protein